jgi:aspartyl-tRNA(Asn)/glutamyl-tRNA(Gln) amidotransferase subunit C
MPLTLPQVEHIANLARLDLSLAEKELFRQQLSAILDYVEHLQELDTQDIPPTSSVLPQRTSLREDETSPSLPREALLSNAPQITAGQFHIPPVFDQD